MDYDAGAYAIPETSRSHFASYHPPSRIQRWGEYFSSVHSFRLSSRALQVNTAPKMSRYYFFEAVAFTRLGCRCICKNQCFTSGFLDWPNGRFENVVRRGDVEKRSPPTPRIQSMSQAVALLHHRAESVQNCPGKNAIHQLSRKPPEYRLRSPCRRISTTHATLRQILCTILSTRNI